MSARDLPLADLLADLAGPCSHVDLLARVESGAVIGDGCTIKSGAFVARGTVLRANVRVDANATFVELEEGERGTIVEDGARIGAGAVVHAGLHIGAGAVVKPGALVTHAVPAGATVAGHPAVIVGWAGGLVAANPANSASAASAANATSATSATSAATTKLGCPSSASNNAGHVGLAQSD